VHCEELFKLRTWMDIFTTEEGTTVPRLSDEKWGMAVPFVMDIAYRNERNMTF